MCYVHGIIMTITRLLLVQKTRHLLWNCQDIVTSQKPILSYFIYNHSVVSKILTVFLCIQLLCCFLIFYFNSFGVYIHVCSQWQCHWHEGSFTLVMVLLQPTPAHPRPPPPPQHTHTHKDLVPCLSLPLLLKSLCYHCVQLVWMIMKKAFISIMYM